MGGSTNYNDAIRKAFETVDATSRAISSLPYDAGCSTVYLFLTDGDPSFNDGENLTTTIDLINARERDNEHFFFFGLGGGVDADLLGKLACDTRSVFKQVDDGNPTMLGRVMNSYYETLAAMRARAQVTTVSWSEPYVSIPNIWGPLTSAVTPVYDKSRDPWRFLGVAAADIPVRDCESLGVVPRSRAIFLSCQTLRARVARNVSLCCVLECDPNPCCHVAAAERGGDAHWAGVPLGVGRERCRHTEHHPGLRHGAGVHV